MHRGILYKVLDIYLLIKNFISNFVELIKGDFMKGINKFNLGDEVYHVTPDSPKGVVLEIKHYHSTDSFEYLIAWGHMESSWALESELNYNKAF